MSRNMNLAKGFCACCGSEQIIDVCDYELPVQKMLTLGDYYDFRFINFNYCKNCGYASENITRLVGDNTKSVVFSDEYKKVLTDGSLENYKDLLEDDYKETQCGIFEAMAMLLEAEKKFDFSYAKIQHNIYGIKTVLRSKTFENMIDSESENPDPRFNELISVLSVQMKSSLEKCLNTLSSLNIVNPYEAIFAIECFANSKKYDIANNLTQKLRENFEFDEELEEFIEELLIKVE